MLCAGLLVATLPSVASGEYSSELRRYPYLTDVVGTSATVNWATDISATTGFLRWGNPGDCTANEAPATATPIAVAGVPELQWKARLSLAPDSEYCYRVYLGSNPEIDLLGTDESPRFRTQIPSGSTTPFSFAVFGDWGWVGADGQNPALANLMRTLAASGAHFALTTGDNAYQQGTQDNYGDLVQTAPDLSAVFGPQFWTVAGASIPLFPTVGNHGFFEQTADLENWPQDVAVASSAGRYRLERHCCLNGTLDRDYPSAWYAFDAGSARFYVLTAAWSDSNTGAVTDYRNDYDHHWSPERAQYRWLESDLAAHPRTLKFAFFHYPLYSDSFGDPSDPYLQGPGSLEGLLTRHGVDIAFTGHAHIYERNHSVAGGPVSYVTGGGGAPTLSVGFRGCNPYDAYAIGWSVQLGLGSACGAAPVPTSSAQVFHFLLVTVSGSKVTVTPINELGQPFDAVTYDFGPQAAAAAQPKPPPRPKAAGRVCSATRWEVKTLSDSLAGAVSLKPRRTSISALRRLRTRRVGRSTPRIRGIETTAYTVRARLLEIRRLRDRDIELLIADPTNRKRTITANFPDGICRGAISSARKSQMRAARSALTGACGRATTKVRRLRGSATINGVGFVDVRRRARDRFELHPVLRFRATRCKRR